jgi:hypothetical protein
MRLFQSDFIEAQNLIETHQSLPVLWSQDFSCFSMLLVLTNMLSPEMVQKCQTIKTFVIKMFNLVILIWREN